MKIVKAVSGQRLRYGTVGMSNNTLTGEVLWLQMQSVVDAARRHELMNENPKSERTKSVLRKMCEIHM